VGGEVVFPGHLGTIYRATNAAYTGLATARTLRLLPDGRVFSERTRSKIRARERGWRHAVDQLVEHGATPPERTGEAADLAAWLPGALNQVTRTLKHTGNLRYLFGLTPTMKRLVASSMSYPPQPYPQISVPRPRP
jgi:hypothetical protein